ncbi:MAG: ferrous-iron efflux pump FieF [Patescibacteria group bacterium]|nr:ferrous-iron efflux pump FieF [Patescibacteria group bacterium]
MSQERRAILAASGAAVTLAIAKATVGILTGSMAVLSSAADSLLDFFVSLVNLFAIKKAESPANEKYHYGFGKVEGLGALFEGLIVAASGIGIGVVSVNRLIAGKGPDELGPSLYVMLFSIAVTGILVAFLARVAKSTGSLVVASDALHYKTDLLSNGAVLVGVLFMQFTGMLSVDAWISLAVSFYIVHSAIGIIRDAVAMLMDRSLPEDEVSVVRSIIEAEISQGNAESYHFFKTRKSGKIRHVEFHLVLRPDILLYDAHEIADSIEIEIRRRLDHAEVLVHLDPFDDSSINESRSK